MKIYKTMENGVRIAEYDESMAKAIADMWNQSGDSWGGDSGVRTADQIASDFAGGSYFNIFVALFGDEAVGLCTLDRYYKDADTAYVHVLNVRPDYHGQKVGKELVLACVERTMQLGYPRLDIHTWAGNTKAVPLYKKCGFLWEDRADTTHLSNYIPTVLSTELFAGFFADADWYADSVKKIEIKPDGEKINKFEVAGYRWQKNGKKLAVGFEKTGRRIRYAETDDYKIEFIAESHELAFGLQYGCAFAVENKSGRGIDIKIAGKSDKGIKFEYNAKQTVESAAEFKGEFYVEPIAEEIDIWRMHPCVLADVYINGKHAEFGLGIEPKFPLDVKFVEKRHKIAKPGMIEEVYINVKNAFSKKASVKFHIPKNGMTRFIDESFEIETNPSEIAMISTKAEILGCGYEKLDVNYDITFEDGGSVNFTKPLHLINQGFDSVFDYETDNERCAVNGLWIFTLYKQNNHCSFYKEAGQGQAQFPVPKLGKPYSDEFNIAKAAAVRVCTRGATSVFEADFESAEFKGATLTQISEFSSSGTISHRHKITNNSNKAMRLYLQHGLWSSVGRRAVFSGGGEIHEISDNSDYGFSDMRFGKIGENWVFDNSENNKSGIFWDKEYSPEAKWGGDLYFEHDTGELAPGEVFETKPVVYMSGIFGNFREFRNYALGINEETDQYTAKSLDIGINGKNPFLASDAGMIKAAVKNSRFKIYSGNIKFSSPDNLFEETVLTNPEKQSVEDNVFELAAKQKTPGVYPVEIDFDFQSWRKTQKRALLVFDKAAKITAEQKDGTYAIQNGNFGYKVTPAYFAAAHSMKYGENEWLFSKYPNHLPYAWWNPFIGGIHANIWQMNANLALREKTSAEFAEIEDNFGTKWSGIKTAVSIDEFADHKGLACEQYFLTLPGLPVLCYFVRFVNNTGGYKHIGYDMNAYISGKENLGDIYAKITRDNGEYDLKMGDDAWNDADNFARISYEGKSRRAEKLYVYSDSGRNNGGLGVASDINQCGIWANANANMKNGESAALRPVFFILAEKELTAGHLADLDRVKFF